MQGPPRHEAASPHHHTTGLGTEEARVKCVLNRPAEPQERKQGRSLILGRGVKSTVWEGEAGRGLLSHQPASQKEGVGLVLLTRTGPEPGRGS